jgi:hypothetical protein
MAVRGNLGIEKEDGEQGDYPMTKSSRVKCGSNEYRGMVPLWAAPYHELGSVQERVYTSGTRRFR